MKQVCCICGVEDDEFFMHRMQTSRMRWMCHECYQRTSKDLKSFDYNQKLRKKKINERKLKRNGKQTV